MRPEGKPGSGSWPWAQYGGQGSPQASHGHRGEWQGLVHSPRVSKSHPAEAWGSKAAGKEHVPEGDEGKERLVASDQTARGVKSHREGAVSPGSQGDQHSAGWWRWKLLMGGQRAGGQASVGSSSKARL